MNFQDGDRIVGAHGNIWERRNGQWYVDKMGFSDRTMERLLDLKVEYPEPKKPKDRKISKTQPEPPPVYQYRYTYKPLEEP